MAILKQRLMKGKGDGTYDTIHLETTSDLVLHGDKTMSAVVNEMQTAIDGKAASGHTHTPASIGAAATSHSHSNYVPTSRTVNGKALSANISLTASDVGAAIVNHTHEDTDLAYTGLHIITPNVASGATSASVDIGTMIKSCILICQIASKGGSINTVTSLAEITETKSAKFGHNGRCILKNGVIHISGINDSKTTVSGNYVNYTINDILHSGYISFLY